MIIFAICSAAMEILNRMDWRTYYRLVRHYRRRPYAFPRPHPTPGPRVPAGCFGENPGGGAARALPPAPLHERLDYLRWPRGEPPPGAAASALPPAYNRAKRGENCICRVGRVANPSSWWTWGRSLTRRDT